jgi:predicted RNA-binding Zn ribbon-like protein
MVATEQDVRSARALRDAVRTLFTCAATDQVLDGTCVATLNAVARAAPSWPELTLTPHPTSVLRTESTPFAAALGFIAQDAVQLLSAPPTGALLQCGAPGCILFYRKHHARQVCCSPRCSNRTRAARHYAKRNTSAAPSRPQPQHQEQI